ncbi:hypothetical protein D2E64_12820 [Mycobacteroides abscessus]|uniref:hypothetical protein n=4 Tax=Mycobacteroides abscessus TaxID=36809 RepID=UPI0009260DD8|nr:hypothetical protein [Mycobacteroides abscessus]MBN7567184.1 hypothetical protein [Mycobacteroides abscessus subsp. massiliense]PVA72223.1 hypothetical protein DDJ76_22740 [Mycobacteroides abscessus]RIS03895.1 hypothetical protein D2E63_22360 [Mycobacteroides abscessus]RIS11348.1 hypothetical protein D2E69_22450 [Mycobacteroides abscessus]RIS23547.1 hypothetical protein D2E67_22005 [Mycobacteroides abscessus]
MTMGDWLKVDPGAVNAMIGQAEQEGLQGAAAGATAVGAVSAGVTSPVDAAVGLFHTSANGLNSAWSARVSAAAEARAVGGRTAVTELSNTEAHNAAELGAVGAQAAPIAGTTLI